MNEQAIIKLQHLQKQVEGLSLQQEALNRQIAEIAGEIGKLQAEQVKAPLSGFVKMADHKAEEVPGLKPPAIQPTHLANAPLPKQESPTPAAKIPFNAPAANVQPPINQWKPKKSRSSIDFEKFIGENIISKTGIVILVIGVGIGTKYAIDRDLLSPLARIILGYLLGAGILFTAIRLKEKYENFSAILLSGAMAIFYLITFAAYDLYQIISQAVAFAMMVIFTLFTVMASLYYNRQWIALLGLVGAYGVPFLLSDGSGRVVIMFSYMCLLNLGILAIAYKRYWHILYYAAFGLSWVIFLSWFTIKADENVHFGIATGFSTIFFLIFYAVFLLHKLVEKRKFEAADVLLLLLNSFIYYGIGYAAFVSRESTEEFAGLFTLGNALIHFGVALAIYRMKLADRNLFYLVSGLVLVFLTLAIPVQLDGGWVTLTWAAEAALLFWIGRSKAVGFYEKLSFPLMGLSVLSQVQDWGGLSIPSTYIISGETPSPLLNSGFLKAILVCGAFGFMVYTLGRFKSVIIHPISKYPPPYANFFGNIFPKAACILLLYFTFRQELVNLWHERYGNHYHHDELFPYYPESAPALILLRVWILNYTSFFLGLWGIAMLKFKAEKPSAYIYAAISALTLLLFATAGNYWLGELRDSTLSAENIAFSVSRATAIKIRYLSFGCAAFLLNVLFRVKKQFAPAPKYSEMVFDLVLHLNLLCAGSSEMITWLKINQFAQFDKLGLTILWGVYSLLLIGLGIFKKKQHLRIGAIALFAITLIKLFFYDIANLSTVAKTIVFISLGMLLLIISFLYNKFKNAIGENIED